MYCFFLGSLQIRYRLDHQQDPEVFSLHLKNVADGHLQKIKILRKQEILSVEVFIHVLFIK